MPYFSGKDDLRSAGDSVQKRRKGSIYVRLCSDLHRKFVRVRSLTFHSTESCVILWKKSPFNRPCSHQSSFYRCLTTRKSLLKKGSLAPLNEVTNQLKQTTHSEKPRVLFSSNSYKNRTLSSPLNAVPTKLNFIRSYETDSPFVQYFLATLRWFYRSPYATVNKALTHLWPFLFTFMTVPQIPKSRLNSVHSLKNVLLSGIFTQDNLSVLLSRVSTNQISSHPKRVTFQRILLWLNIVLILSMLLCTSMCRFLVPLNAVTKQLNLP